MRKEHGRLLTPVTVIGITTVSRYYVGQSEAAKYLECVKSLLEAQLALDLQHEQERVKKLFKEIENEFFAEPQHIPASGSELVLGCITQSLWQALKKQE